jgi:hypothetical protein
MFPDIVTNYKLLDVNNIFNLIFLSGLNVIGLARVYRRYFPVFEGRYGTTRIATFVETVHGTTG